MQTYTQAQHEQLSAPHNADCWPDVSIITWLLYYPVCSIFDFHFTMYCQEDEIERKREREDEKRTNNFLACFENRLISSKECVWHNDFNLFCKSVKYHTQFYTFAQFNSKISFVRQNIRPSVWFYPFKFDLFI